MQTILVHQRVPADHGVMCSFPQDFFGYFGWPTVTRTPTGLLVVAASGLRNAHVCPFGRTVICTSHDDGQTRRSAQSAKCRAPALPPETS